MKLQILRIWVNRVNPVHICQLYAGFEGDLQISDISGLQEDR